MVAVPGVGNGLFHVRREERRLVKRAHRVVCFSAAELVKGLVVHAASRPSALFLVMTILLHHVMGSPTGTGSITPSAMSLSRSALTCFCQCRGTDIGV